MKTTILSWGIYLVCFVSLLWAVHSFIDLRSRAYGADRYEEKQHSDKCTAARVLFFEECFRVIPTRPECEVMWAQKGGRVFDAPPDKPWADEIDCSKDVK